MSELSGGVALVVGAGGGIGSAIAVALAGRGMSVWLCGRRRERLDAVAVRLEAGRVAGVAMADLRDPGAAASLAATVGARLDVVVHAAGVFAMGSPADMAPEAAAEIFLVNALAPMALTRALLPALRAARGQVVVINSTAAVGPPTAAWSVYAASKAALRTLTDGLRAAVNPDGIRVLSVYPGRTASPMQADIHRIEGREYQPDRLLQPEDLAAMTVAALELPRTAEVTDLYARPMRKT